MAVVLITLALLAVAAALVIHGMHQLERSALVVVAIDADGLRRASTAIDLAADGLRTEIRDRLEP